MTTRAWRKCHSETLMSKLLSSPACPKIAQTQHQCSTVWAIFWGKAQYKIFVLKSCCYDFESEAAYIFESQNLSNSKSEIFTALFLK